MKRFLDKIVFWAICIVTIVAAYTVLKIAITIMFPIATIIVAIYIIYRMLTKHNHTL